MDIDSIKEHFILIHDDRQSAKVDYPLFDVLFGSLCAIMAGGRGWTDIREYVMGHHEWFLKHRLFENGVPVDDTFARLISSIKPEAFQECFLNWMRSVHKLTQGEVVAIDGKTLRVFLQSQCSRQHNPHDKCICQCQPTGARAA